jgi:hypothetical protein
MPSLFFLAELNWNGQIVITEYDTVKYYFWNFKFNLENIFNNPLGGATLISKVFFKKSY